MKLRMDTGGIILISVIGGLLIGGIGGGLLAEMTEPVTPVASNGDPDNGIYPRMSDDDKVLWALVDRDDYPQVRAYALAFKEQFPEVATELAANNFSDDEAEIRQTGITVCFDLDDTTHVNKEPVDSVYRGDELTKEKIVNLAIDTLCPIHLNKRY